MSQNLSAKYNAKFLEIISGLNEEQLAAVNKIDGPVMVVAGPGTGKTQILAARIGKILLDTDARPDEILCLTYTDAGAVAMRKRLFEFIGPDAYRIGIYTFHAFCNDVIQENLDYFGKLNLEPLTDPRIGHAVSANWLMSSPMTIYLNVLPAMYTLMPHG